MNYEILLAICLGVFTSQVLKLDHLRTVEEFGVVILLALLSYAIIKGVMYLINKNKK